ncbi:MAG: hypothetical protein KC616_05070 [Myxococcales bacterium]|nr:hypothetical protein [Myxococcales bacterium]
MSKSSYTQPLSKRERALEEAFFREESERLLAAMRAREQRTEQYEALSGILGVKQHAIIDPLLDLGLREENVTALVLAPLVAVAWADRALDSEERRLILGAESELGIDPNSEGGQLLAIWLDHRPHESLLDAWAGYVQELCKVLSPEERNRLRDDTLGRARRIAQAIEKSFVRGGGPSEAELEVMARIEQAFGGAPGGAGLDDAIRSMT